MTESSTNTTTDHGEITVSGTGRVSVQPDLADLRLGVTVSRQSVEEAREEAAAMMTRILSAIDEAGVEKRDVTTSLLAVQPRYEYRDNAPPKLAGYELSNVVEVTVRILDRLGGVIDGSLNAGATSMDSLEFRLADPAPAEQEARRLAMTAARSHADVLAEAAGVSLRGVRSVVEDGAAQPPMPFAKRERMMMAAEAATPVESGSLEVAVRVTVTYRTTA
jgi:uncharacterized protein